MKNGGQPAFPLSVNLDETLEYVPGITYRQLLGSQIAGGINFKRVTDSNCHLIARNVWKMADAMLRNK